MLTSRAGLAIVFFRFLSLTHTHSPSLAVSKMGFSASPACNRMAPSFSRYVLPYLPPHSAPVSALALFAKTKNMWMCEQRYVQQGHTHS